MNARRSKAFAGIVTCVVVAVVCAVSATSARADPVLDQDRGYCSDHWVRAWNSPSTDAVSLFDPSFTPNLSTADQSYRAVATPGLPGSQVRVHLTNRFRSAPLSLGSVTVGRQSDGASLTNAPVPLTFSGSSDTVIPPFGEVVSDPVGFDVVPLDALAITTFVRGDATLLTGHWNGNVTTYISPGGSGDHTFDTGSDAFTSTTTNDLVVAGVDVLSPSGTSSVVAFGDSITDGFVGQSPIPLPQNSSNVDSGARYPTQLQRRVVDADLPLSVVNSGVTSNRLLSDGFVPQLGGRGLGRFEHDVIDIDGVSDVIVLEGINDLGLPPWSDANKIVAGYEQLIDAAHAAGIRVHLGTILPASNALVDGVLTAPFSDIERSKVNEWIRTSNRADSVVDFDLALRDSIDPSILDKRYAGVDNLHPSPAGYRAMADAVDLDALGGRSC